MQQQPTITNNRAPMRFIRSSFSVALPAILFIFTMEISQAGSATWNLNPTSGDWNTDANWTPASVPNGAFDIATFDISNMTAVALSANTTVNSVAFTADASTYAITVGSNHALIVSGTGISNNSGISQNFVAGGDPGTIEFFGAATAGAGTSFTASNGRGGGTNIFL
jgi:hypothetical protein